MIASVGVSIWLGEDLSQIVHAGVFVLAVCAGSAAGVISPYCSRAGRLCAVSMVIFGIGVGWHTGRTVAVAAFNDCVARAETVRVSLAQYRGIHGSFPRDLDQLALTDLPGRRWLRGPLLTYQRTPGGYELSFSDWLVIHRATDMDGFTAVK